MLNKVDFRFVLVSIISLLVGFFTMMGIIQTIIPFSNPLNEMALCVLSFTIGLVSLTLIKK
tara:strand:- start:269 stop:451 length:183 start_codon:yes stop_codon:yes gene_type:complete